MNTEPDYQESPPFPPPPFSLSLSLSLALSLPPPPTHTHTYTFTFNFISALSNHFLKHNKKLAERLQKYYLTVYRKLNEKLSIDKFNDVFRHFDSIRLEFQLLTFFEI